MEKIFSFIIKGWFLLAALIALIVSVVVFIPFLLIEIFQFVITPKRKFPWPNL